MLIGILETLSNFEHRSLWTSNIESSNVDWVPQGTVMFHMTQLQQFSHLLSPAPYQIGRLPFSQTISNQHQFQSYQFFFFAWDSWSWCDSLEKCKTTGIIFASRRKKQSTATEANKNC